MKKILLVSYYAPTNTGLRIISAILKKKYEVSYLFFMDLGTFDFYIGNKKIPSLEPVFEFCLSFDYILISSTSYNKEITYLISETMKSKGIKTIIGGPLGVFEYNEAIKHCNAVCVWEGENILDILDYFEGKRSYKGIKNFIISSGEKLYFNSIQNLDVLPFQDYSTKEQYFYINNKILKISTFKPTVISFETTRGCLFNCKFCHIFSLNKLKSKNKFNKLVFKSIAKVIDELEYLKTCTNVKTFAMIDENFFFRTNEDLESFVIEYNNKIKLPLVFHGDFRTHDYNLKIKIISGLKPHFTLLLGVQTGSEKFNKRVYNRTQNIQNTLLKLNYTNRIFKIAKCNYNISLNLIYAHPLEKKEDIIKTINFMLQADVRDYGIYAYLHPPHLENENLIIEKSTNFGLPSYKLFKRHAFYYFLIFLIYYLKRRKLDFLLPSRIDYLPILRIFDVQLFSKLYYLIVLFGNIKYQIILNNETLALMKNAK